MERAIELAGYMTAELRARVQAPGGRWRNLGVLSRHSLTDAYAAHLVQVLLGAVPHAAFCYHDTGTGQTAEAVTDVALETPCGEPRDLGTRVLGGSPREFVTIATHTYTGTHTIVEWGLFSGSTGGTMLDRAVFADLPVAAVADTRVEWTYTLTIVSGG